LSSLQSSALLRYLQPVTASHESVVQTLLSSQSGAVPALQKMPLAPTSHLETPLHTLASSQLTPASLGVFTQPFRASQLSTVHGLLSLQFRSGGFWHCPLPHISAPLQALPSEQDPALGVGAAHTPFWHESLLQTLPSSQLAHLTNMSGTLLRPQFATVVPGWQTPLPSTQPAQQLPFKQAPLPSVHGLSSAMGVTIHSRLAGSQLYTSQLLPRSQVAHFSPTKPQLAIEVPG
jgi:hypothetical protein